MKTNVLYLWLGFFIATTIFCAVGWTNTLIDNRRSYEKNGPEQIIELVLRNGPEVSPFDLPKKETTPTY